MAKVAKGGFFTWDEFEEHYGPGQRVWDSAKPPVGVTISPFTHERRWDGGEGPFTLKEFIDEYGGTVEKGEGCSQWKRSEQERRWDNGEGPFTLGEFVEEYGGSMEFGTGVAKWLRAAPSYSDATLEATACIAKGSVMALRPSQIHFTHDSISAYFTCGRLVHQTYQALRDGVIPMSVIPRMSVTLREGKWWASTGNRRLWTFRKLESDGRCNTICAKVVDRQICRLTTRNGGTSVRVRGG